MCGSAGPPLRHCRAPIWVQLLVRKEDAVEAAQILEGFWTILVAASTTDHTVLYSQLSHLGRRGGGTE